MRLGRDQVHCWHTSLDLAPATLARLQSTLSSAERARGERFRFERDRRRYIAAHGVLRQVLAGYLGVAPQRLAFVHNAFGKPSLHPSFGDALRFNLSHSAGLALIGIALDAEIGVDVEQLRACPDELLIARQLLPMAQASGWCALARPQRTQAFLAAWTLREACLKARGIGFGGPAAVAGAPYSPGEALAAARRTLLGLAPQPGYVGALAVARRVRACSSRRWNVR